MPHGIVTACRGRREESPNPPSERQKTNEFGGRPSPYPMPGLWHVAQTSESAVSQVSQPAGAKEDWWKGQPVRRLGRLEVGDTADSEGYAFGRTFVRSPSAEELSRRGLLASSPTDRVLGNGLDKRADRAFDADNDSSDFMKRTPAAPSVSHTFTMRLNYPNGIGMFARIAAVIGRHGGDLGGIDIVSADNKSMTRDVTVRARNQDHVQNIVASVRAIAQVKIVNVSDRVFLLHLGGKIALQNKVPVTTRDTLSMAYTPGVARVSMAIAEDRKKAWQLTIKGNSVAVVSDGTAVLGLGDIGPEAAMPVMEGKAMLFKEFANIDAYPVCLDTKETDEIVATVAALSVGFGGINLEDISAPRCFEIEQRLQELLDIPVFHDDQHGTAVVVLAALLNALRLTRQKLPRLRIVISGAGAAGTAITKMLLNAGARDIVICDRQGILSQARSADLNPSKAWLASRTNPRALCGSLEDALKKAEVFIGVSGPGTVSPRALKRMAPKPIVFALANPVPEIMPEEAASARIVATGRSDYPNQINNVLAFPGIFRGALNVRARQINEAMKLAAAHAIANCVPPRQLNPEYIVPSVFNRDVVLQVAAAVQKAALRTGVARKKR